VLRTPVLHLAEAVRERAGAAAADKVVATMDEAEAGAEDAVEMKEPLIILPQNGKSFHTKSVTASAKKETRKANQAERNGLSAK
jgi:hypothetical protein